LPGIRKRRPRTDAVDSFCGATVCRPGDFRSQANIEPGAKYLKQLIEKYEGNLGLALAAYNTGPAAVDEATGISDIPETRNYVDAILKSLKKRPTLTGKRLDIIRLALT
jgi:hypothetical protein